MNLYNNVNIIKTSSLDYLSIVPLVFVTNKQNNKHKLEEAVHK